MDCLLWDRTARFACEAWPFSNITSSLLKCSAAFLGVAFISAAKLIDAVILKKYRTSITILSLNTFQASIWLTLRSSLCAMLLHYCPFPAVALPRTDLSNKICPAAHRSSLLFLSILSHAVVSLPFYVPPEIAMHARQCRVRELNSIKPTSCLRYLTFVNPMWVSVCVRCAMATGGLATFQRCCLLFLF